LNILFHSSEEAFQLASRGVLERRDALSERDDVGSRLRTKLWKQLFYSEDSPRRGREGATNKRLTRCAVELLQRRAWPGNVRELRCLVEMAVREAASGRIDARLLDNSSRSNSEG
jgi:transcriptional regulator of acetoin/glycerol metabolism